MLKRTFFTLSFSSEKKISCTSKGRDPQWSNPRQLCLQTETKNFGDLCAQKKSTQTELGVALAVEDRIENNDDDSDDDDWWFSCECDAGMIGAAPSKQEYESLLKELSVGMHLELWWQPLNAWYKGQITESRKDNSFVKVLCKLENGRFDHTMVSHRTYQV